MTYLGRVADMLGEIRSQHRYRRLPGHQAVGILDFGSNDYLGLGADPQVVEALKRATRAGSGGARLLSGRHREHALLEEELAAWTGRERALLFSSGYLAAIGAIPVLAACAQVVLSDRLNHASLIDGIRLARPPHEIYDHGTTLPERGAPALVVSESLFGMEGDAVDPRMLLAGSGTDGIVVLDEAHALGIVGTQGAGTARDVVDPRLIVLGTLSKALGVLGGFIAGPAPVIELLVNRARSFVFDTALPSALVLAARIALVLARRADDRRQRLHSNVARLGEALRTSHIAVPSVGGAVVPVILGSEERTMRVAADLLKRRIFVPAIRPPTVPAGTSRLRVSVRADHTTEQIDRLAHELCRCIVIS